MMGQLEDTSLEKLKPIRLCGKDTTSQQYLKMHMLTPEVVKSARNVMEEKKGLAFLFNM
jgi:hypothetical protein